MKGIFKISLYVEETRIVYPLPSCSNYPHFAKIVSLQPSNFFFPQYLRQILDIMFSYQQIF